MNITEKQVQSLCDHAQVSVEDARAALEGCDGDVLDALVWLEQQGIISESGVYSYATDSTEEAEAVVIEDPEAKETNKNWFTTAWNWLIDNRLKAYRKGDGRQMECPMAAFLALLALAWWLVAALLIVGFFTGWRFRFVGPNLGRSRMVQDVMEKIDEGADTVVNQVRRNIRSKQK